MCVSNGILLMENKINYNMIYNCIIYLKFELRTNDEDKMIKRQNICIPFSLSK